MCTAITYRNGDFYFGRTLDVERSYGEKVVVMPRGFDFKPRHVEASSKRYAVIGMAALENGYPLFFDAANERGLAIAGLSFPQEACYFPGREDRDNITPFELIPYILTQCANLYDAKILLEKLNILNESFDKSLPLSPLHWIVADKNSSLAVESVADGLKLYDCPVGVLTNSPEFPYHMTRLCDFVGLSPNPPENKFGVGSLTPYSRGMGAMGLPGDCSSVSRFVRAAFVKTNSVSAVDESCNVSQFFHILGAVAQQRGCTRLDDGSCEITAYTSCVNADRGVYYYTTYENRGVSAVDMKRCDLDSKELYVFEPSREQKINFQN